jgi:tetratricopeptide (TPR) repeat protein
MRGAERYFDILNKKYPYHTLTQKIALTLGIRKAAEKKYESALNYFKIAARSSDRTVAKNALCLQGEIYFDRKEYQKAWETYQHVVSEQPNSKDAFTALAYFEIGNINHLLDDDRKAKEAYKKAIEFSDEEIFKEKVKSLLQEIKEAHHEGA